ncbi:hypothetical protein CEP54_006918 [Fusarium duplospermum]|uniref:Uncharacterized protein n=1 Tax=Fusarium duplospermum TaxID=1325734 RepID=A0A428Q4M5_9HYPO|nr:hypothetical protein CEP54_006918 [Fusarium duplospermum]
MANFDYYDDPASSSLVSSTFTRRSADPRFETRLLSTWSDVPRPLYVGPYATSNKLQVSKLVEPREPWDETTLVAELAANWDDYNLFAAIGPSDATLPVV